MKDALGEEPSPGPVDPYVTQLLAPLDDAQQSLVNELGRLYGMSAEWPVFDYIEQFLAMRGLDALSVLGSFPVVVGAIPNSWGYWPVFYGRQTRLAPESRIELTILGLSQAPDLGLVSSFLKILSCLAEARASSALNPFTANKPLLPLEDLWRNLRTPPPAVPKTVLNLLPREPATAESRLVEDPGLGVCFELSRTLLRYQGVGDLHGYIQRVVDQVAPARAQGVPAPVSPYSLPAALDYLSIVWMEHFGRRLARAPNFEVAAKLAHPAASGDEFNSRLSGLAETLKLFDPGRTPNVDGHPVKRMGSFLEARISPGSMGRVWDALEQLNAVRRIRVSGQHAADNLALTADLRRFGIAFPILNWDQAWNAVSAGVVVALDAIREEIQAADTDGHAASASPEG